MNNVSFRYPGNTKAVADATLTVSQASRVLVTGGSGAGKSTLLKILAGLQPPTEGILLTVKRLSVAYLAESTLHQLDRHLQQTPQQYIYRTCMGDESERLFDHDSIENHLTNFGLDRESATRTRMELLSKGAKAKVVLASVMCRKPHILILDNFVECLEDGDIAALTSAIKLYKGGVIIVSENSSFGDAIATEKWAMSNGSLKIQSLLSVLPETEEGLPFSETVTPEQRATASTQEDQRRRIKAIERKIKNAHMKPLTEQELKEMDDQLNDLKEILAS